MFIENKSSKSVKKLVSDCGQIGGSECTSNRSQDFLEKKSILHKTSVPFVPAQNGFIEGRIADNYAGDRSDENCHDKAALQIREREHV